MDEWLGVDEKVVVEVADSVGATEGLELDLLLGDGVGFLEGTKDGTGEGFLEGVEDGSTGMAASDLSQVQPQLLKPISKFLTYDVVFGVLSAFSAVMKYSVLIPSMKDKYGTLLSTKLLTSMCSFLFLLLPDSESEQSPKSTPHESESGLLQLV